MSQKQHRKLAAILFADIVGYTALMQKDEGIARQLLDKFYITLNRTVEQNNGQVINNYGDGCLCTFESAVAAVQCAKAVQQIFQTEPNVPVRIGLHSGDVFFEKDNVFGDSVNIASRIESLGVAGAILFSKQIKRHIANQTAFKVQSLGEFHFKNVEKTMEVFALANEGLIIPKQAEIQGKGKQVPSSKKGFQKWINIAAGVFALLVAGYLFIQHQQDLSKVGDTLKVSPTLDKSIAVLPFKNTSNDPEQDFFGDGIAEEILVSLAQIKSLKVAGRTSAFSFKENQNDLKTIGKTLGVKTILEGSIRKAGEQIRITARLTNAEDGFLLWSARYERNYTDIFAIQDEIAQEVVRNLKIELSLVEQKRLAKRYTENIEVYTLYLKALDQIGRGTGESYTNATKLHKAILEIEPNYAPSLAYQAFEKAYSESPQAGYEYIERALAIDPELGVAYKVKGIILFYLEHKFLEAQATLEKAIELGDYSAIGTLAELLLKLKKYDAVINVGEKLKEVEPLEYDYYKMWEAMADFYQGNTNMAIRKLEEIIQFYPKPDYFGKLAKVYLNSGRIEKAIQTFESSPKGAVGVHLVALQADASIAYFKVGAATKADSLLLVLKQGYQNFGSYAFHIAAIYSGIGKYDLAFEWLEKAYDAKELELIWLNIEPAFDPIRQDTRFQDLLNRVGFPRELKN